MVPLVSIYGHNGIGKSTLVRYVCKYIPKVKLCFVNLCTAMTVFDTLNLILNELGSPSLASAQGLNLGMVKIREAILNAMKLDSEEPVLRYGISLIILNVGMYFVAPVL